MVLSSIPRKIESLMDRFFNMLDSELVALYQQLLYIIMVADGFYNLFATNGIIPAVEGALSPPAYMLLLILFVLGPLIWLASKAVDPHSKWGGTAMRGMMLGDFMAWGSFTVYLSATIYTSEWGRPNVAGWLVLFFWAGTLLLWVRDFRRIREHDLWEPA